MSPDHCPPQQQEATAHPPQCPQHHPQLPCRRQHCPQLRCHSRLNNSRRWCSLRVGYRQRSSQRLLLLLVFLRALYRHQALTLLLFHLLGLMLLHCRRLVPSLQLCRRRGPTWPLVLCRRVPRLRTCRAISFGCTSQNRRHSSSHQDSLVCLSVRGGVLKRLSILQVIEFYILFYSRKQHVHSHSKFILTALRFRCIRRCGLTSITRLHRRQWNNLSDVGEQQQPIA